MPYVVKQYLLPQDKTTEYLILFIALFLIIIVWAFILHKSTFFGEGQTKALLTCPVGQCPTNRFTGEKRCNKNEALALQYDPIYEVCNPLKECTAIETPYAVQANGSTSLSGLCDVKGCACSTQLYTPSYIESIFNLQSGVLNTGNGGIQNIVITQIPSPYVGEGNNVPIQYQSPATQFWEIGLSYLSFMTPNICSDLYASDPDVNVITSIECINRNPCLSGRMAYLPTTSADFQKFEVVNLSSTGVGCVPNSVENPPYSNYPNSCQNDLTNPGIKNYFAPVFNPNTGRIYCFDTGTPLAP
jgi:hypothetical protein